MLTLLDNSRNAIESEGIMRKVMIMLLVVFMIVVSMLLTGLWRASLELGLFILLLALFWRLDAQANTQTNNQQKKAPTNVSAKQNQTDWL